MIIVEVFVVLLNTIINALSRLVNEIERWAGWNKDDDNWQYESDVLEPDPFV